MTPMDEEILRCVVREGRMSFRRIARTVGVSEQTAARRFRSMRDAGQVRVVVGRSGFTDRRRAWTVRIRCRPDAAATLAEALAARDEVGWVSLVSGGSEIDCAVSAPADTSAGGVLGRLPHTREVLSFDALALLHTFAGSSAAWTALGDPGETVRDPAEVGRGAGAVAAPDAPTGEAALTADDLPLLEALGRDGRASGASLARELGWPAARVTGRLEALLAAGELYVATDFLPEAFGYHASAVLQLRVPPGRIRETGRVLAAHRETGFVAATTGATNLMAVVVCRRMEDLFDYVTTRVGALPEVQHLDVAPVLRRVKESRCRVVEGRLVPPGGGR